MARNAVRDMRGRRRRGKERQAERRQKGKLKVGVDIPTREEIRAIVASRSGPWRPLILTAIFTGLRASELRGLRWENVDFDEGRDPCPPACRPLQRDRQAEIRAPASAPSRCRRSSSTR